MDTLLGIINYQCPGAPGERGLNLWRAVFALAHVDGEVSDEEVAMIEETMTIFRFTDEQCEIVREDLKAGRDPVALFKAIEEPLYRAQFFRLARIIVWCDGVLHENEMAVIEKIKESLGDDLAAHESDLRWMNRKPDLPLGEEANNLEEEVMKHVIYQMIDFYEQRDGVTI